MWSWIGLNDFTQACTRASLVLFHRDIEIQLFVRIELYGFVRGKCQHFNWSWDQKRRLIQAILVSTTRCQREPHQRVLLDPCAQYEVHIKVSLVFPVQMFFPFASWIRCAQWRARVAWLSDLHLRSLGRAASAGNYSSSRCAALNVARSRPEPRAAPLTCAAPIN